MKELLMEIGTEEIPAGFIPQALMDLESLVKKELEVNRISFNRIRTLGTPRRLVLVIDSVAEKQRDEETKKIGPSKQAAFDAKGNPTKAAIGFAKGQSIPVESLILIQTEKGEYVCAVRKEPGRETPEILSSLLPKILLSLPFQKSMRWADVPIRFARPIHWILALFGGEIIREGAKVSGKVLKDEDLLDEVNFLVEYPVALCGTFDNKFLSLPREILIHSMKEHQRYFPLVDDHGILLPHFVCISNINPRNREAGVRGNEKVLKARLSDAAFFFEDDLKIPLEKRVEQLKKVVFQAKLGTSYEKVMRFKQLALWMTERIDPKLREAIDRTSHLCKTDLVTGMVGEFPKLQGIVGREYARLSGEKPEVYHAIYEHYLPAFAGDRLPNSPVG